jgi:hypothetical protein
VPPPGVHCSTVPVPARPLPVLPSAFTTQLEYVDVVTGNVFNQKVCSMCAPNAIKARIQLMYLNTDARHMFAFGYNAGAQLLPVTGTLGITETAAWVVHDFDYGLQYVLSVNGTKCLKIERILDTAGDARKTSTGVELQTAMQLLLHNETYMYIGLVSAAHTRTLNVHLFSVRPQTTQCRLCGLHWSNTAHQARLISTKSFLRLQRRRVCNS